jgi:hypothetical protein
VSVWYEIDIWLGWVAIPAGLSSMETGSSSKAV